jgi:hypothetical protein
MYKSCTKLNIFWIGIFLKGYLILGVNMIVKAFVTHKNKAWECRHCMRATLNYEIYIRLDWVEKCKIVLYQYINITISWHHKYHK